MPTDGEVVDAIIGDWGDCCQMVHKGPIASWYPRALRGYNDCGSIRQTTTLSLKNGERLEGRFGVPGAFSGDALNLCPEEFKQYAVPPADGWVPSEMILDRTEIPKNILLGVTIGGWNHLRHILTIANILADRGYNLTLAKRGKFLQSEQYPKINFISLGEEIDLSKDPETIQLVKEKVDVGRFKKVFKNHYAAYDSIFLRLKEISEMIKPDLFFCDTVNNEPCFDVAWLMKKPLVGISTSPLDPIFGCKVNMENESFWERFRCEFISPLQFLWSFKSSFDNFNKVRAGYGLPSLKSPFERWQNSLFLVDNFFGYETPVPLPPLYQEIGPVLPDYFPSLTPDIEKFLNSHKRTMFVALGSFLFLSSENYAKLLQSIIEVIENNIVDGVIWANIEKYRESFPSNITLSDGRTISTSNLFDNKNSNIFMTSFAPQFSILNHTNTKIFLSHSGSGSVYESLYAGTPLLSLPITYDQPGNAEKLELAGVALTLDKTNLEPNTKRIEDDNHAGLDVPILWKNPLDNI
ncbi:13113_t:CDS:10 [Rhizophagus irregularis]|nr:13113_t:CDS:10 [Rhizophagus irregularis]